MPKGTPSGDRVSWDESKERRILLSYIMVATESNPGAFKVNWAEVAKRSGLGVTADATHESAERRLLLSYIQVTNPDVPDWKTVADRTGLGFSNEACRQRFAKIKKADAEAFSAGGANAEDSVTSNSVDGADTPATTPKPKAKRAPRTPKTKSTGGKRGVKLLDGEDDEEEPQTPTKKPKVEKKVKHEPVEDKVDEI